MARFMVRGVESQLFAQHATGARSERSFMTFRRENNELERPHREWIDE